MNKLDVVVMILWGVTGILTLILGDVTRMEYFCCWICLLLVLAVDFYVTKNQRRELK